MLSISTSLKMCHFVQSLPITRRQILESSKLKDFADDNFIFDENGRELSNQVENTVEKGEIARYEQFLLFPRCFQKACFPGVSKGVIVWEWFKGCLFSFILFMYFLKLYSSSHFLYKLLMMI